MYWFLKSPENLSTVSYKVVPYKTILSYICSVMHCLTFFFFFSGDTGPLVYPAGFVWIFWVFHSLTDAGTNIKLAQCLFAVIFLLNTALVFRLVPFKKLSRH